MTWEVLGGVLLFCLGLLLGSSWTIQALQPKLRRQIEERRRLNEEWAALRTARRQRGESSPGVSPQTERDWYLAPSAVEYRLDDD